MTETRKHNTGAVVLIVIGIVLVAAACITAAYNAHAGSAARQDSQRMCGAILADWDEAVPAASGTAQVDMAALPVLQLEGVDVIARLTCPALGLDIPVGATGEDENITPVRQPKADGDAGKVVVFGKSYQGDGAFENVDSLANGDEISLTLANGTQLEYRVVGQGIAHEQFSDHFDLLLYYQDTQGARHWAGCSLAS